MNGGKDQTDPVLAAAARWHARLDSPDMDWEAFADWLEADPVHRAVYDGVALLDAGIDAARADLARTVPANDRVEPADPQRRRPFARWAGGGMLAAGLCALLLLARPPAVEAPPETAYATGRGATRALTLADGSRVVLDRSSELRVRDGGSPVLTLVRGGALFTVRHDAGRSFTVRAGGVRVRDIGTRFEVSTSGRHVAVAVAEGRVAVDRGGQGLLLSAGQRFDSSTGAPATVRAVARESIGSWTEGRLVYSETPLPLVAADLSRYVGRSVAVDPALGGLRVSGVVTIGDGSQLVGQIEALLPVRAVAAGDGLRLVAAAGGTGSRRTG
jgi:transmembrane sensor